MTPDPTQSIPAIVQLAEQVAELKKERDTWQGRYRAAYNLACDKDKQIAALKGERDAMHKRIVTLHEAVMDRDSTIHRLERDKAQLATWSGADNFIRDHLRIQEKLKGELAEARRALADLFAMVENGTLVRDISQDHLPGYGMRQMPLVRALGQAKAALAGAEGKA